MTDDEVGAGSGGAGSGGGADAGDPEERTPIGTLFVLMVYLMVLAGMWGTMYWLLVGR
jgi:hypothetical protein